jgi:hypothetical protein
MATPNISSTSGSKSGSGTIGSGGARASINTQGPLPTFNLIVELFYELQQNYQGVRIEKL